MTQPLDPTGREPRLPAALPPAAEQSYHEPVLARRLSSADRVRLLVRALSIPGLGGHRRRGPLVAPLCELLADPSPYVRAKALRGLAGLGRLARNALPEIVPLLADSDPVVRKAAHKALRTVRLPRDQLARTLRPLLACPVPGVAIDAVRTVVGGVSRWAAPLTIRTSATELTDQLAPLLSSPEFHHRDHGLTALVGLMVADDPAHRAALVAMIGDPHHKITQSAIRAIADLGPAMVGDLIVALTAAGSSPRLRANACEALGLIGLPAALPALPALRHTRTAGPITAQVNASWALMRLGADSPPGPGPPGSLAS